VIESGIKTNGAEVLSFKLGIGVPSYDQFTVVIILNIGNRVIGMVVDGVSDVVTLTPDQIRPAPRWA
jgi:purine-binding chemotaxis protein CheW